MRTACLVIAVPLFTPVEINAGSRYTEIDASVEAALREFVFSQVDGRKHAVGAITFRFRLETQD